MSKHNFVIAILILLLPKLNQGQVKTTDANVVGHIVCEGKHIPFATVSLKKTSIGVSADASGHYMLVNLPVGKCTLVASAMGFKSLEKEVDLGRNHTIELNFELQKDVVNLLEVTVFGEASVLYTEEIEGESLQRKQALEMKDIFANLPSVTVGGGGGANTQRLYLRGIEGNNLNITIDGAKQGRSLFQHNGGSGSIDPGLLKKVSVATGADASQSSGALGGSIAFETIDAQDLSYEYGNIGGKISTGAYSASNSYLTSAIVGAKLSSSVGILAAASYNDQEDYRSADYGIIPFTARETTNLFAKLSMLDMNSHNLKVSGTYNITKGNYITGGPGSDFGIPDASMTAAYQEMSRGTYTVDYHYKPVSPLLNIKANLYYNRRKLDNKTDEIDVISNNFGGTLKNEFVVDTKSVSNKFTLGADYDMEDGISKPSGNNAEELGTDEINNTSKVFGAFAQGISKFSIFSLTYGMRFDSYDSNLGPKNKLEGNRFSPNAGVAIEPIKGLYIYGNYKEAIRATGIIPIQGMANIVEGANINNGKPFKPESSEMFDGGLRYSKYALFTDHDKLTASGKYFKSTIENLIEISSGGIMGAPITGIMNDTLGVVSKGFEFSLSWEYKKFSTRVNYIHVDIKDKDGNYIDISRRKAASAGDRLNWSTAWQASPEIHFAYSLNAVMKLKDGYEKPRSGYTIHNIQLFWTPQTIKGLSISTAVNNLLDEGYSEHTSIAFGESIVPEPGRDLRVTVTYNF